MSANDFPAADDIAVALVAAAKVTGEDPMTLTDSAAPRLFRLAALQALNQIFPAASWKALGALTAVEKPVAALSQAKRLDWWISLGAPATKAALAALEAA